ncbi:hypothetical protein ID867_03270 [Streptomyces parvulus]|nr:hypothetical protein [Streptomyces parvulus]
MYDEKEETLSETGEYRSMTVVDPRGGEPRFFSLTLPGDDSSQALGVVGSGSGPRTVLATEGDTLLRARPTPLPGKPPGDSSERAAPPRSRRTARAPRGCTPDGWRSSAREPHPEHRPPEEIRRQQQDLNLRLLWVTRKGGDAVLAWSGQSVDARLYDVDDPGTGTPVTWDCGRPGDETWNRPQDITQTGDGDLAVLCLGDSLAGSTRGPGCRAGVRSPWSASPRSEAPSRRPVS